MHKRLPKLKKTVNLIHAQFRAHFRASNESSGVRSLFLEGRKVQGKLRKLLMISVDHASIDNVCRKGTSALH